MPLSDRLPGGPGPQDLAALLGRVGSALLRRVDTHDRDGQPSAVDRAVAARVVLHDPRDPLPDVAGAILLVPAVSVDDDLEPLLAHAAARGCPAVGVKLRGGDPEALTARAAAHGVALLAVDDDAAWEHVVSVLESALGSSASGDDQRGGDSLFALAHAAAASIGGAVSIEDLDRSVVAYSTVEGQRLDRLREEGILGRRVPDVAHNLERYRAVSASTRVERFPAVDDALPRTALAIRAGSRVLGSIWVVDPPEGVSEAGERTLREAAGLAAMHMLRRRTSDEVRLHLRAEIVGGALEGRWSPRETHRRLALAPGARLGLVGFATLGAGAEWLTILPYLSHALSRFVATFRPDAGVVETPSAVYVLLPDGGGNAALRLAQQGLAALARGFRDQACAAVAGSLGVEDLVAARREVDDILREVLADALLPRLCRLDDVRERVLVARVSDELSREERLRSSGVAALLRSDREQRTEYRASLLAWFEEQADVRAAASRLGVHPNTLRYRVRRAAEQFDLPIDDGPSRLGLWMQLRAAE
ncbi:MULTISPECIES: CdaR family transcriptional regulator [Microbacterium]|uniref:PucR family transcriptional regulator n=1 Tax=Microbacterium TaxID=33882 RepID=UPI0027833D24|nr:MULTISPECIES: helix-turn-helix domain-containing protein [Microbacterium]MDQ1084370.1 DNA-binding PucR family transcriptional regulator [Microbacterium sp. SORGH_AS_0344]MDQ1170355.1 DNA-binding PucR family transcriptional regulator [Microbacterium proteolyticum]